MTAATQFTEAPGSSGWRRTFLGLLCAPASAAVVVLLWYWPAAATVGFVRFVETALVFAVAGGTYGWLFAFAVGWPAHMVLRVLHWSHPVAYLSVGALLGPVLVVVAECLLFWLLSSYEPGVQLTINVPPPAPIGGAVAGLVFWLIRRPDSDARRPQS
jgi:hypothetical protein